MTRMARWTSPAALCWLLSLGNSHGLGQGMGRPFPTSGFGAELPLGAQGTPLHFNIPMERSHPYVSGMAPSRPPAAAPFPASFPTGIWPPGQLHRGMEAPQRTVPGLGAGQPQLPVFNHMLSNHQVGHGSSIPYGQVPAQHQTLQREVVMETGSRGHETSKAAVGYGGVISWVLAFMAVTSMLWLKALGGVFRRDVHTLQEKVKQIPTLFMGLSQSGDPYVVTPEKSELVILKDASPTRKEPIKVESETVQETKLERPEKLEEPEAYVEMDGRLLSLDQLCQEIGARRVHSPRSSASASDEVVVEEPSVRQDCGALQRSRPEAPR